VRQKLGFKKSSLSQVYAPGFQPVGDFVKLGSKSRVLVEFMQPDFTQLVTGVKKLI